MFGSEILEVAIGVIFIYILVSIICTALREGVEAWLKTRARYLENGIRELLQSAAGGNLVENLYNNPLISGLYSGAYKAPPGGFFRSTDLPSYIPSKNFAMALMDMAARGPDPGIDNAGPKAPLISLDAIRSNVEKLNNQKVQRALLTAIDTAQGDLNKAQANIEAWYDSAMDRISGRYKRTTQWMLFVFGLVVAVGLNVNTITIADFLYRNDAERAAIVARAEKAATDPNFPNQSYEDAKRELNSLNLPIGWTAGWGAPKRGGEPGAEGPWNDWFAPVLGWLMTAFAATLGAPFWFDLLNKIMVIRSTVKPHEKSPEEASEDRQVAAERASAARTAGAATLASPPVAGAAAAGPGATGAAGGPSPLTPPESMSAPLDADSDTDGCEVDIVDPTPDEALPESEGGVA